MRWPFGPEGWTACYRPDIAQWNGGACCARCMRDSEGSATQRSVLGGALCAWPRRIIIDRLFD